MSYNGSGTFQINTSGQPVVAGTVISSTAFNALTADLATGLSTAITKDGQTTTTARIPFAAGINSSSATDSTSTSTGSIITAGGVGVAKALYVGTTANVAGAVTLQSTLGVTGVATFSAAPIYSSLTASSAVATDASKALVSVTNTGTGNNVLATSPTLVTPVLGAASATSITVDAGAVGTPSITTTGDTNTGIFFPAADTIAFSEGGAEAMRIDSSGNVGIGTASPAYPLTLANNKRFGSLNTGGAGVNFAILDGSNNLTFGDDSANTGTLTIQSKGNTLFSLNGSERARITDSGNLLVGTTSSLGTLAGSANASGFIYGPNDALVLATNNSNANLIINRTNSNTAGRVLSVRYNGSEVGSISLTASTTAFNTSSDYRLKEYITPMTGALAKVALLKPCTYKWKVDGSDGQGFIAHELAEVEAGCVTGEKDAVETYTDEDGNEQTRPKYQGVDTSFLVATLTAAIQEQQALIQSLTTRITALEAK